MYFTPGASREWICSLGPSWGQCAGWLGRVSWLCWTPCRSGGTSSRERISPLPPGGCACSVGVTKQRRERERERGRGGGGRERFPTRRLECRLSVVFCVGAGVGGGDPSEERKAFRSRPRFDQRSRMVQARYRSNEGPLRQSGCPPLTPVGRPLGLAHARLWFGFIASRRVCFDFFFCSGGGPGDADGDPGVLHGVGGVQRRREEGQGQVPPADRQDLRPDVRGRRDNEIESRIAACWLCLLGAASDRFLFVVDNGIESRIAAAGSACCTRRRFLFLLTLASLLFFRPLSVRLFLGCVFVSAVAHAVVQRSLVGGIEYSARSMHPSTHTLAQFRRTHGVAVLEKV